MQTFLTESLWLSNPGHDHVGFQPPGLWDNQDTGVTYILSNAQATYTFEETANGLSLRSWTRAGSGVTWSNSVRALWRVTVFDVLLGKELGVSTLEPSKEKQEWIEYTADGLSAGWQVNAGPDRLRVVVDMSLDGDMLLTTARMEWVGTPTRYAVDAIAILPLRVQYREIGSDVACTGAIKGVTVRDPRYRFRFVPDDDLQPQTGWLRQNKNLGVTSSGKSLSLPVWGYYAETDKEGWMTWVDDTADEIHSGVFQSDGQRLAWEYWIPMPNWIQAGNSGSSLSVGTRYGLRPFLAGSIDGWWDTADFYRQRLEVNRPSWYVTKTQLDPDRHPMERKGAIWLDWDIQNFSGSEQVEIEGAVAKLRSEMGVGTETPVFGWVSGEARESRPHMPGSPALPGDTVRTGVRESHGSTTTGLRNAYLGIHKPADHIPYPLIEAAWGDGTTNWWQEWDGSGMYVIQRAAAIDGETSTTRGLNGSGTNGYYLEETQVVDTWDSSIKRLTTVGTPAERVGFARWGGTGIQFTDPSHGTCSAEVDSIFGKQVNIKSEGFLDSQGIEREPVAGMTVTIADLEADPCHHALLNSEVKAFLSEYLIRAQRDGWSPGLIYMDVYPARTLRNKLLCSGTHASWNRLLPGYTPHPSGGGSWWVKSIRDYFQFFVEAARSHQSPSLVWLGCEYLDESFFPWATIGLHTSGYVKLWRTFDPHPKIGASTNLDYDDPDNHGMRPVPMFAVVHAGRCFSMQRAFSFGNGALSVISRNDNTFPVDAPKFRRALSWWMCGEWVWGLTPLSYTHSANDALPVDAAGTGTNLATADLWDADQYTGGDAADADIASIRDLWVSLTGAELTWALSYLRNGQLLAPGEDQGSATFDMQAYGVFDKTSASLGEIALSRRNDLPPVWDAKIQPRAVHGVWRASTGMSVCVFFLNWTDTGGTAAWKFTFSRYGLSGEVFAFSSTAAGALTREGSFWSSYTYSKNVAAWQMKALILVPEAEMESLSIDSDVESFAAPRSREVTYWAPVLTLEVQMRASGVPLDLSGASSRTIRGLLPDGSDLVLVNPAFVTDGTDGRMYVDLSGSLFRSQPGVWQLHGIAVISGDTLTGSFEQVVSKIP